MAARKTTPVPDRIEFFATPAAWRRWLQRHHATRQEVWVGFHKRATGKRSITWPESVDQALCFGWIDGVRQSIDASSYRIRFTPRKPRSVWSHVNVRRATELIEQELMTPAGLSAFEARTEERSGIYSYEGEEQAKRSTLASDDEARFRANAAAWAFFEAQAPWYRRTALHWVVSAKRPETRERRLATLIDDSAQGRRIAPLRREP